jgi:glutathione S-transferase
VKNFYADLDTRLTALPFVAGDHFSAADITGLVTVDFATKAMSFPVPDEHKTLRRWFEKVCSDRLGVETLHIHLYLWARLGRACR